MEAKQTFQRLALLILSFCAAISFAVAAYPLSEKGSAAKFRNSGGELIGSVKSKVKTTFIYKSCWNIEELTTATTVSKSRVNLTPTEKCSRSERGNWLISIFDVGFLQSRPIGTAWKTIEMNGQKYLFSHYGGGPGFNNGWHVSFSCGRNDNFITVEYAELLENDVLEKVRKSDEVPALFRNFVTGFRCGADADKR